MIAGYKLARKLGSGAFAEVYEALNLTTNRKVALKLERVDSRTPQLQYEAKVYAYLLKDTTAQSKGIPMVHLFTREGDFNVMAMDLMGPSLEDLFNVCNRKFSLKTVLMLADQMLTCIEFVHSKFLLHRDIKPDNFVLGIEQQQHKVYLIDYGLSKKYIMKDQIHIPYREGKSLTGTARYASICNHLGLEQGRRDDLECLGHVLMYFLRGGLPWQNLKAVNKAEKYRKICEKKVNTKIEDLCREFPNEFESYMRYCRSLKFEDKPDYEYLKKMFRDLFEKIGYERDYEYDWIRIARNRTQEQRENSRREERKEGDENNPGEINRLA